MSCQFIAGRLALALAVVIGVGPVAAQAAEVNVYSYRKEDLVKPLLDRFAERTGVTVNLVTGNADELLQRLVSEGANTRADVLITVDAGHLSRAKAAGVLQPVAADVLTQAVPESYRDPQGYWFGLSLRARPIMYALDRVDPGKLSTYEALADEQWKGRICIRSSGNVYNQSMVASMIAADGEAAAETWAKGLVRNFARPPRGGDRDQILAAASGECDIAIANTYYLGGMLTGSDEAQRTAATKVGVFWPNQEGRGTHVNVSGAGMTSAASNTKEALQLLEFLVSDEAQAWYAESNNEYPVKAGVAWPAQLEGWGRFKADAVNLSVLGENNAAAVMLMDRAGWK